MLAADLALALDPARLAEAAGLAPDRWQRAVLRARSPRLLLNCCRQSGKSTITAALAIHEAVYAPGALILLVAPTWRQSAELFRKALALYRALGRPVAAEAETALTLTLENGSRLVSLPGKEDTVRGYSGAALIALDEASRVPDALYASLRPMLAVSGGRLVALSTPAGRRGWWYEAWAQGGDDWERVEVPATACPRIAAAFLAEERRALPASWFAAEYECGFTEADDAFFRHEDIEAAFDPSLAPLFAEETHHAA